jgi:pre-rRNA-processing protein IPI3
VQLIDFFKKPSIHNILHDATQQHTPSQLSPKDRWSPPSSDFGAALCLALSYDGTTLLSGHKGGAVVRWEIPKGRYASTVSNFNWPVSNIQMLPPTGLYQPQKRVAIHNIVKPRIDHALQTASSGGIVPAAYTLQAHLTHSSFVSPMSGPNMTSVMDEFSQALTHSSFPASMLAEGLMELTMLGNATEEPSASANARIESLEQEIVALKKEISIQESARRANVAEILDLRQQSASCEAMVGDLLDQKEKWFKDEQHKLAKVGRLNEKKRKAYHEAAEKGLDGDVAMKNLGEDEEMSGIEDGR